MSHRRTRPALIALAGLPVALALVGCGSDDDAGDAAPAAGSSSAASTPTTSAAAPSPSSSAPSTPSTPSSAGPADDALLAAVTTALGAADGTVFSIDLDDGGWEVSVVTDDGAESDLTVSADGAQVTRGPVPDTDDTDDTDDLAERQQLLQDATVTLETALATARAESPDGAVDGLDLDLDRGQATWDVQLDEDTADERTVVVDAVTGEVVRVERDD